MKLIKLVSINCFLIISTFIFIELWYRYTNLSDSKKKSIANVFYLVQKDRDHGLYKFDPFLGYVLNSNVSIKVKDQSTERLISINTLNDSTRLSTSEKTDMISKPQVLTVGDSFTFGYQVSDHETWQSCLNRKNPNQNFINAGAGGYGVVQPIRLGEKYLSKTSKNIDLVLLSTVVGVDAFRDRFDFRSGFPKPSLLKTTEGELVVDDPPKDSLTALAGKFTPKQANLAFGLISNFTFLKQLPIGSRIYNKAHILYTNRLLRKNKSPASIPEVYEWGIRSLDKLHPRVVWILQYASKISQADLEERKHLTRSLKDANVPYIDTFDYLHGSKREHPKNLLWHGHHSYLGNTVVCDIIDDYLRRNKFSL